ncbi:SGNH/GDSL hydrolase family protein [Saccharopolyspora erythraea]|uniref:SGNH/GDSL hydrolase family protein n=1 Tax=Saccharopolyspora erythraea TaxID=1836 RepID=UPI001BADEC69|nr:SGNH/GDSL hydrolase family protein [Saccharopolyspora erythraea]QUH03159.1 SGNH/GDSL hydrolase family protein [Saccharopolyspora erythraea]
MTGQWFARYVALGDSQTEGLHDGDECAGYRGWADRLAEHLSELNPRLRYANLAVRGSVARQVRAGQLPAALELGPDLVTVCAGMNDVIRPCFDAGRVCGELDGVVAALTGHGVRVVITTFPDIGKLMPIARRLVPRVIALNAGIRESAARHGATLVDAFPHAAIADQRLYSADRLHANAEGHARIAAAVAHALELPGFDDGWTAPLAPAPPTPWWTTARTEVTWLGGCVGPWIGRGLLGASSGNRRTAKRPLLAPVAVSGDRAGELSGR